MRPTPSCLLSAPHSPLLSASPDIFSRLMSMSPALLWWGGLSPGCSHPAVLTFLTALAGFQLLVCVPSHSREHPRNWNVLFISTARDTAKASVNVVSQWVSHPCPFPWPLQFQTSHLHTSSENPSFPSWGARWLCSVVAERAGQKKAPPSGLLVLLSHGFLMQFRQHKATCNL